MQLDQLAFMYDNDAEKVEKTIALAKEFQKVINGGKMDIKTCGWFEDGGVPTQDLTTALVVADNTTSVKPSEYEDVRKFKEEYYF